MHVLPVSATGMGSKKKEKYSARPYLFEINSAKKNKKACVD
jgi:hypothetical protein